MSKKFYAENRSTGERWKPSLNAYDKETFLMMFDSGYLAVVEDCDYSGYSIKPLDNTIWKTVIKENIIKK